MSVFRKFIFILGLILSFISISAIINHENDKDKTIGKDY